MVAPLGAAALVFNFIFAYALVGTRITNQDLLGTFLIIVGAILVAYFGDVPKDGTFPMTNVSLISLVSYRIIRRTTFGIL